jgi:hypothetical protein
VTDSGGWPGEETAETRVMALSPAERRVLAALAVVGRASLSADELADLSEVQDVAPLIEGLEARSLVRQDERRRYSAVGRIGEQIRGTDEALASADRLLGYLTSLAKGGRLTPERLAEDAEAILGLSEWAAEHREWARLLELVKTLEACFGIAHRVQEWLTLLERGRSAARALGDERSEVWALQQLATASESAGDPAAAQRYLREADELQRGRGTGTTRELQTEQTLAAAGSTAAAGAGGGANIALWIVALLLVGGLGVLAGYLISSDDGHVGQTTARVPVTVTAGGTTVTTSDTVTLPATTIVSTTTQVTTETTTVTTTVTTAAGIP